MKLVSAWMKEPGRKLEKDPFFKPLDLGSGLGAVLGAAYPGAESFTSGLGALDTMPKPYAFDVGSMGMGGMLGLLGAPQHVAAPEKMVEVTRQTSVRRTGGGEGQQALAYQVSSPLLGLPGALLNLAQGGEGKWEASLVKADGTQEDLAKSPSGRWQLSDGKEVNFHAGYGVDRPMLTLESGPANVTFEISRDGNHIDGSHMNFIQGSRGSLVNHWEPGSGGVSGPAYNNPMGPEATVASVLKQFQV